MKQITLRNTANLVLAMGIAFGGLTTVAGSFMGSAKATVSGLVVIAGLATASGVMRKKIDKELLNAEEKIADLKFTLKWQQAADKRRKAQEVKDSYRNCKIWTLQEEVTALEKKVNINREEEARWRVNFLRQNQNVKG